MAVVPTDSGVAVVVNVPKLQTQYAWSMPRSGSASCREHDGGRTDGRAAEEPVSVAKGVLRVGVDAKTGLKVSGFKAHNPGTGSVGSKLQTAAVCRAASRAGAVIVAKIGPQRTPVLRGAEESRKLGRISDRIGMKLRFLKRVDGYGKCRIDMAYDCGCLCAFIPYLEMQIQYTIKGTICGKLELGRGGGGCSG